MISAKAKAARQANMAKARAQKLRLQRQRKKQKKEESSDSLSDAPLPSRVRNRDRLARIEQLLTECFVHPAKRQRIPPRSNTPPVTPSAGSAAVRALHARFGILPDSARTLFL